LDEARDKIAFGRERRRLMDDEDKKISAYHEAGHALVAALIGDKNLPVHKVSIIPRGQSLGSTMFIPKKDILNQQKKRVTNQICTLMGGRVSEEVVFDDITSGASQDIKMATEIARHMVCDWGMSGMGPVAYGENQDHIFLGKEITRDQNYSEKTAQHIDSEIYKIIDAQHKRSTELITERREALETIAKALLEYETLEGKHVYEIIEFGEIRSPVFKKVETPKAIVNESPDEEKEKVKEGKKDEGLGPDTEPALA
jgi:cell division protease FtsH